MKKKDYLAMVCRQKDIVADKKYCSSPEKALAWAKDISNGDNYEIYVFKGADDVPLLHYGLQSLWNDAVL